MVRRFVGYRPIARDDEPWVSIRIEEAPDVAGEPGTPVVIDEQDLDPVDTDPTDPAVRTFTTEEATLDVGWLRVVFLDDDGDEEVTDWRAYPPTTITFATSEDIVARIGRALTAAEQTQVALLLILATGLLTETVDKDADWAQGLADVHTALRVACIEATVRVLLNPHGARSRQEQLGSYSYSQSFTDQTAMGGLMLLEREVTAARRAVYGKLSGSARVESMVLECADGSLPITGWIA